MNIFFSQQDNDFPDFSEIAIIRDALIEYNCKIGDFSGPLITFNRMLVPIDIELQVTKTHLNFHAYCQVKYNKYNPMK